MIDGCDWLADEIDGPAWAAGKRTNDMQWEIRLNGSGLEFGPWPGDLGGGGPPGKICMAYRNTHTSLGL